MNDTPERTPPVDSLRGYAIVDHAGNLVPVRRISATTTEFTLKANDPSERAEQDVGARERERIEGIFASYLGLALGDRERGEKIPLDLYAKNAAKEVLSVPSVPAGDDLATVTMLEAIRDDPFSFSHGALLGACGRALAALSRAAAPAPADPEPRPFPTPEFLEEAQAILDAGAAERERAATCPTCGNQRPAANECPTCERAADRGWQPIDTAPNSTDPVVVFLGNEAEFVRRVGEAHRRATGEWITSDGYRVFPTHWRPLPQPPESR